MVSWLCVLLLLVVCIEAEDATRLRGRTSPSFKVHSSRDHHGAASRDVVVETGGSSWYLTAIPTDDSSERQRETKFVWTIDGLPYSGQTVGPITFDSCGDDGIGVELVELRAVEGTSWFDSRDVVARLECRDRQRTEL